MLPIVTDGVVWFVGMSWDLQIYAIYEYFCLVLLSLSLVIVVVLYIHDLVQLLLSLFFILVMLPFVANKDEYIKMAEPIEMPFEMWTRMHGSKQTCIRRDPEPHTKRGNFEGESDRPRTYRDMSGGRYTQSDSAGDNTDTVRMPIGVY